MTRISVRRGNQDVDGDVVFQAGKNLLSGEARFKQTFGSITSLESDLLLLAASIFAADRAIYRGDGEEYSRSFELRVPAVNIGKLQPLRRQAERILRKLSNDAWRLTFLQIPGKQEAGLSVTPSTGETLLFSGGLDSLAAAVEFGDPKRGGGLHLVSHITHNSKTTGAQNALIRRLDSKGISPPHTQFLVSSRAVAPAPSLEHDIESSQRTRSFLFLTLAALVARRLGHRELLLIAENGQMAVHLPLTEGRIGARSTHTAHPDVLKEMEQFLQAAIDVPIRIKNPYVGRTKQRSLKYFGTASRRQFQSRRVAGKIVVFLGMQLIVEYAFLAMSAASLLRFMEQIRLHMSAMPGVRISRNYTRRMKHGETSWIMLSSFGNF